uniref:Uncharacterized protein n=1 Tax=Tetranychus urticae TaxID=32264 RepID=T1KJN7_TETUR
MKFISIHFILILMAILICPSLCKVRQACTRDDQCYDPPNVCLKTTGECLALFDD